MTQTNGIGSSPLLQILLGQPDRVSAGNRESAAAVGAGASGAVDKAQLSSAGSVLAHAAFANDDVRSAKVDQIKAALADGSYNVSAGAVADKLIQNMLG